MESSELEGSWTYRSLHNDPTPIAGDPQRAIALFFAEAEFRFKATSASTFTGVIDWGSGGLDLSGTIGPSAAGAASIVSIVGLGRPGTQTDGWEYDYNACLAHTWPIGVGQVSALVGSVIRAKPHNGAAAGYTASFIAVKR